MPWTTHGHWTGLREPIYPGPPRRDCGGPHRCMQCALEAHRIEAEIAMSATAPSSAPFIGQLVHYVSHGSPTLDDGTQVFSSRCRAAFIVDDPAGAMRTLCVLNPTGIFFQDAAQNEDTHEGGTWHHAEHP